MLVDDLFEIITCLTKIDKSGLRNILSDAPYLVMSITEALLQASLLVFHQLKRRHICLEAALGILLADNGVNSDIISRYSHDKHVQGLFKLILSMYCETE